MISQFEWYYGEGEAFITQKKVSTVEQGAGIIMLWGCSAALETENLVQEE